MPCDSNNPSNQQIPLNPEQFLKVIYAKVKRNENPDNVIPLVEKHFEFLLHHKMFQQADQIMQDIDLSLVPPYAVLRILEVTKEHRQDLEFRYAFFARAKDELTRKLRKFKTAPKWFEGVE